MNEIRHFSHIHPLTLVGIEHPKADNGFRSCHGCQKPKTGPSYICTQDCNFFLHKSCAELSPEIDHPNHPEHPLILLQRPSNKYSGRCICDICRGICTGFIYHCRPCRFDIDTDCSLVVHNIKQKIEHESHKHQLNIMQKLSSFLCDACGIKHEDASYLCTTCGFWISQKCASSPTVIKTGHYHEPLQLIYSVPASAYYSIKPNCGICNGKVKRTHWAYVYPPSKYFVHLTCATSEIEPPASREKDASDGLKFNYGARRNAKYRTGNSPYSTGASLLELW